jgi:hypothetical protein
MKGNFIKLNGKEDLKVFFKQNSSNLILAFMLLKGASIYLVTVFLEVKGTWL